MERMHLKRMFGMLLALVLVVSMMAPTYAADTYKLVFYYPDLSSVEINVTAGEAIGDAMPADAARDGYVFDGWYYNDVKIDASYVPTSDVLAIAPKFSEEANTDTYKLTFYYPDLTMVEVEVTAGEAIGDAMPADAEKDGYVFEGWYYYDQLIDATYVPTADIVPIAPKFSENQAAAATYSLTFYYPDLTSQTIEVTEGEAIGDAMPADAAKDGYVFDGWYYYDQLIDASYVPTADITPIAPKFSEADEKYTLVFVYPDLTVKTIEVAAGETIGDLMPEDPVYDNGEGFCGWYYYDTKIDADYVVTQNLLPIAPTAHKAGEAVIENEVAANCTTAGSYDSVTCCTLCGEEVSRETVVVPATGHTMKLVEAVAPTCTEAGSSAYYVCEVCGRLYADQTGLVETTAEAVILAAAGHVWDAGVVTKAATATENGEMTYTCTVCSAAKVEVIPATGEVPTEVPTEDVTETPTEVPTEDVTETPTEAPTEDVTETPTEVPTEEVTEMPTEVPTEEVTEMPTEVPTEDVTEAPTEDVTETPTEAPTEEATENPTEAPTEEVTENPTEAPTEDVTENPTEVPTEDATEVPTEEATEVPTEDVTETPTEVSTEEATGAPTVETSEEPAASTASDNSTGTTSGGSSSGSGSTTTTTTTNNSASTTSSGSTNAVKTGDSSPVAVWMILVLVSGSLVLTLKRKQHQS